jgi:hypothetical protein
MQRSAISWLSILVGVGIGIGIGLFYAWRVDPRVQTNTVPWQLSKPGQTNYMIMVSMAHTKDHDLQRAAERLAELRLGADTWQIVADTACELARSNYASTNSGIAAIHSMVDLAQTQGVTGCASALLPPPYTSTPPVTPTLITATPTLIPPATKTPTPTLGPSNTPAESPTEDVAPTPSGNFRVVSVESFCDARISGVIQIFVQDTDGTGLPGIPVQVSLGSINDDFFTGLKADQGSGYADYQMEPDKTYTVILPGYSDPSREISSVPCNLPNGGGKSVASYRVTIRQAGSR